MSIESRRLTQQPARGSVGRDEVRDTCMIAMPAIAERDREEALSERAREEWD